MKYYWYNLDAKHLCRLPCNRTENSPFKRSKSWIYICEKSKFTEELLNKKLEGML